MRERLIALLKSKSCWNNDCPDKGCEQCNYIEIPDEAAEQIADTILADGWIRPPCKIGDTVYVVKHYFSYTQEYEVRGFHLGEFPTLNGSKRNSYLICYHKTSGALKHIFIKDIGKTVFLTKEEAEAKLKEGAE